MDFFSSRRRGFMSSIQRQFELKRKLELQQQMLLAGGAPLNSVLFDAKQTSSRSFGGSGDLTVPYTCSGTNRALIVCVLYKGTHTGVTYNGVAMTALSAAQAVGTCNCIM